MSELIGNQDVIDIPMSVDTHGIGDSFVEKRLSTCNIPDNLSTVRFSSSFASCASFKAICKAWKLRDRTLSTMSVDRGLDDLDKTVEELTSRLNRSNNDDEESKELAKCVSLCVVLESRTLNLTDSSDEDIPHAACNYPKRFLQPEEIRGAHSVFKHCDKNNDNFIDLPELKLALEKLSVPQTHYEAKEHVTAVVGENVTRVNFCQFLLIYADILEDGNSKISLLSESTAELKSVQNSIDVPTAGVSGARRFFEAKIAEQSTGN